MLELASHRLRALIPEGGRQGKQGGVTQLWRLFVLRVTKWIKEEPLPFRTPCHYEGVTGDRMKGLLGHPWNSFCSDLAVAHLFPSSGTRGRAGQMQVLE